MRLSDEPWWGEWLTCDEPMCAELPWHNDHVADIYNGPAALLIMEARENTS